ncbi:MAG: hypothetical protein LBQ14_11225 [Treponema sp.]|jgi:hypothetical protein|nr:hypothetical protein [Treponema sp.]
MIIEKVDPGREAFSDYSLEEAILTIGGIEVDLSAEQGDQEAVITFAICNGEVRRGMMPCCEYVADVIIPPRKYDPVEVENERGGNAKEDEEPATRTESVPVPLDLDSVTLRLWPVTARSENEEQGVMSC